jgi:MFS family permease
MKLQSSALWIVVTSAKLTVVTGWIIAPVVHLMRAELHIDPASAGLIITMHALTAALFYPVFEPIAEKGIKKLFVCGLLLYGAAGGSGLVITSYWLLLVSRAVLGIGVAAVLVAVDTILDLYQQQEKYEMMKAGGSLRAFGSINWPILGGMLGVFSWHIPFAVYVVTIPLGIAAAAYVPDIQKEKKTPTFTENNPAFGYSLSFLIAVFLYSVLVFLPHILDGIKISSPFFISLFFIVIMVSSAAASTYYQKITAKLSCKQLILVALALWTGGFAIISQTDSGFIIAASVVLFGIGEGLITSVIAASTKARTNKIKTFRYMGQFLAPFLFAPVGLNVFLTASCVAAAALVVIGLAPKNVIK